MNKERDIKAVNELYQVAAGKKNIEDCKVLGKKPQKRVQREGKEQESLFQWAKLQECKYPDLKLLFAIPNGGSRHKLEAINLKKQGLKSGIPDICLPVARANYHGLWIELKVGKGKTSDNQDWWIEKLTNQGYRCKVCYGFEEAKNTILEYLEG